MQALEDFGWIPVTAVVVTCKSLRSAGTYHPRQTEMPEKQEVHILSSEASVIVTGALAKLGTYISQPPMSNIVYNFDLARKYSLCGHCLNAINESLSFTIVMFDIDADVRSGGSSQ